MTEPQEESPIREIIAKGAYQVAVVITDEGVYLDVLQEAIAPVELCKILLTLVANVMKDEGVAAEDLDQVGVSISEKTSGVYTVE